MENKDIPENTAKLLNLVRQHPNLPIVPIVWSEVVAEEGYAYWLGKFGNVEVGEYAVYREIIYTDKEDFKEGYYAYNYDELYEKFDYDPTIDDKVVVIQCEKEIDDYVDKIAEKYFTKAIIVYIKTP